MSRRSVVLELRTPVAKGGRQATGSAVALAPQRHRWIDARGPERGNPARENADERHHRRYRDECERIVRLNAEQQALHQARQGEGADPERAAPVDKPRDVGRSHLSDQRVTALVDEVLPEQP